MWKLATTFGATRTLLRELQQRGINYTRDPLVFARRTFGTKAYLPTNNGLKQFRNIRNVEEIPKPARRTYIDINPEEAGANITLRGRPHIFVGKKLDDPRAALFHEYGHTQMFSEDPTFIKRPRGGAAHKRYQDRITLMHERLADRVGEAKLRELGVPIENIRDYKAVLADNYEVYKRKHPSVAQSDPELYKGVNWLYNDTHRPYTPNDRYWQTSNIKKADTNLNTVNPEQAYLNGFVKRAADYGLAEDEAVALYKEAAGLGGLVNVGKGLMNMGRGVGGFMGIGKDVLKGGVNALRNYKAPSAAQLANFTPSEIARGSSFGKFFNNLQGMSGRANQAANRLYTGARQFGEGAATAAQRVAILGGGGLIGYGLAKGQPEDSE